MLLSLNIQNFILIENLNLDFCSGFSVISGETGAGKSIILDAIQLLLGGKYSLKSSLAKDSTRHVILSGIFFFDKDNIELKNLISLIGLIDNFNEEPELIIKRIIYPEGRSKFFINDTLISSSQVIAIALHLVEVCGQNNQQSFLDRKNHLYIIDDYAQLNDNVLKLRVSFNNWKNASRDLNLFKANIPSINREIDVLNAIVAELDDINMQPDEDKLLLEQKQKLNDANKVKQTIYSILEIGSSGIRPQLYNLQKQLTKLPISLNSYQQRFESIAIETEDLLGEFEAFYATLSSEQDILEQIENRLSRIKSLARKHNIEPSGLQDLYSNAKTRLEEINNIQQLIIKLEKESLELKEEYIKCADELASVRKKAASIIEGVIVEELESIKMGYVKFAVKIEDLSEDKWHERGMQQITFVLKTNPSSDFGNINLVASGGELSRLMLAIKVALAKVKSIPTVIFDEVDIGIGGAVADSVGKKLSELAKKGNATKQVLVITHQPQVVVHADHHFVVCKDINEKRVNIDVNFLTDYNSRIDEVARMLSGGKITQEAKNAAKKLFEEAQSIN